MVDHVQVGRRYLPKLVATGALHIADWVRDDLPDLLWPGAVAALRGWAAQNGRESGAWSSPRASWTSTATATRRHHGVPERATSPVLTPRPTLLPEPRSKCRLQAYL
jgi:hypothetical protein